LHIPKITVHESDKTYGNYLPSHWFKFQETIFYLLTIQIRGCFLIFSLKSGLNDNTAADTAIILVSYRDHRRTELEHLNSLESSVVDPHHFHADPDADADPNADPDYQNNADADPDPQYCWKAYEYDLRKLYISS
jgi:hypothetical protein